MIGFLSVLASTVPSSIMKAQSGDEAFRQWTARFPNVLWLKFIGIFSNWVLLSSSRALSITLAVVCKVWGSMRLYLSDWRPSSATELQIQVANFSGVQKCLRAQVGPPLLLRGTHTEPSGRSPLVSVSSWGPSFDTKWHIHVVQGGS